MGIGVFFIAAAAAPLNSIPHRPLRGEKKAKRVAHTGKRSNVEPWAHWFSVSLSLSALPKGKPRGW